MDRNSLSKDAEAFLRLANDFKLGHLPTEASHSKTGDLSQLAKNLPLKALEVLREVDLDALTECLNHLDEVDDLRAQVTRVWSQGGRIFCCGCGATGRLALTVESIGLQEPHLLGGQLRSFMAGGDVALVHSLEGFEDNESFGEKHLLAMGFQDGDLLIAVTEGGETPYVIGAVEAAERVSAISPYFLYCNPTATLAASVARSCRVIENTNIKKIEVFVGPMALAGSTRMQAATVLEWLLGEAVLYSKSTQSETKARLSEFIARLASLPVNDWLPLLERESELYKTGGRLLYIPTDFGITVFTDTTERSPTFNLSPFEPQQPVTGTDQGQMVVPESLCFVGVPATIDSDQAWQGLLGRPPHSLNWGDISKETCDSYLSSFDFSTAGVARRSQLLVSQGIYEAKFYINKRNNKINFSHEKEKFDCVSSGTALYDHLLVKLILNSHSTLVMGRLDRYESNLMTWVKPSNGKLIDRATRYVEQLIKQRGGPVIHYNDIVKALFKVMSEEKGSGSLVLQTLAFIQRDQ